MLDSYDGVRALGDDHQPAGAAVLHGQHGDLFRNFSNISQAKVVHLKNYTSITKLDSIKTKMEGIKQKKQKMDNIEQVMVNKDL